MSLKALCDKLSVSISVVNDKLTLNIMGNKEIEIKYCDEYIIIVNDEFMKYRNVSNILSSRYDDKGMIMLHSLDEVLKEIETLKQLSGWIMRVCENEY